MIIAVVVTYNRLECLKNLLSGLKKQTVLPDQIIVVNNDSTDGTREWLDGRSDLIVIHQENLGGSGGFHTGVKAAFERHADWIWMMDDDVIPRPECLEKLMEYSCFSKCLNTIHLEPNGLMQDEEKWFNPESCKIINYKNRSYPNKKIWFRNICSFEGLLIAREIVEKIGYPDKRFFLAKDDLLYGYRASKFTNVAVVSDAIIDRQNITKSKQNIYSYLYYSYRNIWIINEYLNEESPELIHYRKRRILWQFIYGIYHISINHNFKNKFKSLSILFKAFRDYNYKKQFKTF